MKLAMHSLPNRIKQHLGKKIHFPRYVIALTVVLVIAFDLRIQSVTQTVIDEPVRADVEEYLLYGYNLRQFGIYSKSNTLSNNAEIPPKPDAIRAPIYGMFVALFLNDLPLLNIPAITLAQALISTITVLIVFLLCRRILPIPFALVAAGFTAVSPHLVAANIHVLSETLFCFMLALAVYVVANLTRYTSPAMLILAGLGIAVAALTHPMLLYFIVPATIFLLCHWGWKKGYKKAVLFMLGFGLLYGTWTTRNLISVDSLGDNHLMRIVMRTGTYPNLMYQDNPETFPYPYHFDPDFKETSKDIPSVFAAFMDAFREAPMKQLRWYVVDKPIMLYSWNLVEGSRGYDLGQKADVFTYGVTSIISTPYNYLPHFRLTHGFMKATHWIWVILMACSVVVVWLPRERLGLSEESAFVARFISLLLIYHALIMIAGVPLARYSVPMRPFMYIMSMLSVAVAIKWSMNRSVAAPTRINRYRRSPKRNVRR